MPFFCLLQMVSSRSAVKGSMVTFDIFVKTLTGKTLSIGYHRMESSSWAAVRWNCALTQPWNGVPYMR